MSSKASSLCKFPIHAVAQSELLRNPDGRISIGIIDTSLPLLSKYADSYWGIGSGDSARFARQFWEVRNVGGDWELLQVTFSPTRPYMGREQILFWQNGSGQLYQLAEELKERLKNIWRRGSEAWGKSGVVVSQMGSLSAALYSGEIFQNGVAAIVPKDPIHLPAIWAFCSSQQFAVEVRKIDQKMSVTNATLVKVPFDLARWQAVADAAGPLPEPYSDDPTQWLFHGDPARATAPLQVALARLLGYRWPQNEEDGLRHFADEDGVVCLDAVAGEPPAAERLRAILAAAWGERWSPAVGERLLTEVGFGGRGLDAWLRDGAGFFKQHCALFHNRPFLWQIWDGRRDGFSAIVNYHALDGRKLDRLIYTYLGAWIAQQRADAEAGVTGADLRLGAAQALQKKLIAIREGEPPYDIYVRWKSLDRQPLGWQPDLNDGVRLNVRPFVMAGVLRAKFTVNWNKDRGHNPDNSERLNDLHLTRAEREAARANVGTGTV